MTGRVSFASARRIVAEYETVGDGWTAGPFVVAADGFDAGRWWVVICGYRPFIVHGDDDWCTPGDGVRLVDKTTGRVEVVNPLDLALGQYATAVPVHASRRDRLAEWFAGDYPTTLHGHGLTVAVAVLLTMAVFMVVGHLGR